MIINEELFHLEDQAVHLAEVILAGKVVADYRHAKDALANPAAKAKQQAFQNAKTTFERIEPYGKYAPDFREKQRALRQAKRTLDLDETVAAFRLAENQLQDILDQTGQALAQTISEEIKVDAGNPFFTTKGCGGACHAS